MVTASSLALCEGFFYGLAAWLAGAPAVACGLPIWRIPSPFLLLPRIVDLITISANAARPTVVSAGFSLA